MASALDAAHAAGLVHRDVKPANMLLDVRPGRPDHVYLSDFGLSKSWQGTTGLTGSGLFLGTLDYAAPEQIEGRAVDGRTDQYALACAAFELLAGEPPFRRDQGLAVLYAQLSAPPPSLAQLNAGLDRAVDAVLARGLAKAPAERFSGCGDFADALRVALGLDSYNFAGQQTHPPDRRTATVIAAGSASVPVRSMEAMTTTHGPAGPQSAEADLTAPGGALVKRPKRAARGRVLAASLTVAVLAAGALGAVLVTRSRKPPTHPPIAAAAQKKSTSPAPTPTVSTAAVSPADFRVCTLPADGCTTSYSRASMKTEPTQIVTSADGSGYVKYLTWSGWATSTAHGTGVLEVDNCTPNCAEGTYSGYPATITLSGLTPYGHGKQAYSVMVISAPSAPYPQEPFTTGLVP